jgi:hypothetical protein
LFSNRPWQGKLFVCENTFNHPTHQLLASRLVKKAVSGREGKRKKLIWHQDAPGSRGNPERPLQSL